MRRYNPKEIEPKWQKKWEADGTYKADLNSKKPKYIAMSMFNYPSGAGIHIGHAMNYTIPDVMARFKRQQGYESYHPVGWDSFGLPAENYAIKVGVSPQASMSTIIPNYHKQYKAMGWSNDWSKEIATHDPLYYKWSQWIFSEMYRDGLAYQDARMQWWCEKCQTVLANEQVIDGKCWRHDSADDPIVEKKEVKQWFFKITDYADELLEATDDLDWTESVKLAQKNWIGKSVGAEVTFGVEGSRDAIDVFTTRIDTLFSGAFIVLAPEHELTEKVTTENQLSKVREYVKKSISKTEVERQADREKSGVFTGAYAINPVNNKKIPIWVGDFVLPGYGTGAVFGDIHDERDFEFLKKFKIPAEPTVIPEGKTEAKKVLAKEYAFTGEGVLINSGEFTGMRSEKAREKITAWLAEKGLAKEKTNYKMRDWSVSRQRYWGAPIPIINCEKCGPVLVPDEDLPVLLPELKDFQPSGDGRSALARAKDWLKVDCPTCGGPAERETDTLDTYIDSSWYMLRYFDPVNREKIFDSKIVNRWMPIDFYNGADHATAHLLYARFVTRFLSNKGLVDNPEPFKKFLYNGKVTAQDGQMFSKSKGNGIDPLEIIDQGYGADALRTYLMFAAPLELWAKWDPRGVPATHRFLSRLWNLTQEYLSSPEKDVNDDTKLKLLRLTNKMIKKMTEDIEENRYNTAIATAMGTLNELYKLKVDNLAKDQTWEATIGNCVACIAPFAPHIADELWQQLGNKTSVHIDSWPKWDDKYLVSEMVNIVVQVNGKLRANISVPPDSDETTAVEVAKKDEKIQKYLITEPKKTIFVKNRLINFVV
jgi:leucyl-tRNA synthetase